MFWFSSNKVSLKDSITGITDCHSHILPGVDDGVKTMEDSLVILQMYENLGVRKLWLTPHIMEDFPNTTDDLKARFEDLKIAYAKKREESGSSQRQPVELALAAEYMMDGLFQERLSNKDLLSHGVDGYSLLVETSYYNPPYNLMGIIQDILSSGYYPILAHPERYIYMNDKDYKELKGMNVRFQMNLSSLAGLYGTSVQKKAEHLLKQSYYNCVGSDLHRKDQLENMLNCKVNIFRDKILD